MGSRQSVVEVPEFALVAVVGGGGDAPGVSPLAWAEERLLAAPGYLEMDASRLGAEDRRLLARLARRCHVESVAIAVGHPALGPVLEREGFHVVHLPAVPDFEIRRTPLPPNRKQDPGPFDIIGDVHGCADELAALLRKLGWREQAEGSRGGWRHPEGRRAIFLGDLVDRGPAVVEALRIVRAMTASGVALCVPGNHDDKLARWLAGRNVQMRHGLEQSAREMEAVDAAEREAIRAFIDGLVSHYVLDGGRLVVAHAGLREHLQGRDSPGVRQLCLYGEADSSVDPPIRFDWAADYRGAAAVVYGHTPVAAPEWRNNTVNIDTGAVYGGRLTALRYPEREFVSVPAARAYAIRRQGAAGDS